MSKAFAVNIIPTAVLLATGDLIGMFDWFFANGNRMEFVRDAVIVLFGAGVGIPIGLQVNRWWHSSQDEARRRQLLTALKHTFKTNIDYLHRAVEELNVDRINVPSFPMDLTTLEGTSHIRAELLDGELAEQIDKAFYELQHVDRRMSWLQNCVGNDPYGGTPYGEEQKEIAKRNLSKHAQPYHQTQKMDSYIDTLENSSYWTPRLATLLGAKVGTLQLIAGKTFIGEPMKIGGAIMHCRRAKAEIMKALGEPPEKETVDDQVTVNGPIFKSIVATP